MRVGAAAGLVKGVSGGAKYIFDWETTTWGYFRRKSVFRNVLMGFVLNGVSMKVLIKKGHL